MFNTSFIELQAYIFRQLGSEQHIIELSPQNFLDIYNKNVKFIQNYSSDAVNEKLILLQITGQRELIVNSNIIAITDMNTTKSVFSDGNFLYPGISPVYDFLNMNSLQTSAFLVYVDQMRDLRNLLKKQVQFRFNPESHKLVLDEAVNDMVLLRVFETEDITLLYDYRLFLLLLERDCWLVWKNNLGKYLGNKIGNGVGINLEHMQERYDKLDEQINKEIEDSQYEFLAPFKIN